jgi:16S rRNA processing protein RimM
MMKANSSQIAVRLILVSLSLLSPISSLSPFKSIFRSQLETKTSFFALTMADEGRRQKKNKYGDFSKTDALSLDPLEAMIAEAEQKNQQVQKEQSRKKPNQPTIKANPDEKRARNEILFPDTKTIDPYDPTTYGYTELGTIIGAHGVKGEIKILSVTDFPERLCLEGVRHLKAPNKRAPRKVKLLAGRHRKDTEYLILIEGIGDRDEANKLRGCVLYAREEERPQSIEEDEYMINDLVGLDVLIEEGYLDIDGVNLGGKFVGTVAGIVFASEMCAIPDLGNDLLEISLPRGPGATASWSDELVLIPFVPALVPRVEINQKTIHITPPFGLLDLTYVREEKVRIKGFLPPSKS